MLIRHSELVSESHYINEQSLKSIQGFIYLEIATGIQRRGT